MATTTERGYGAPHQNERRRWAPVVKAGQAACTELICLMSNRHIAPTAPWDLAHDRTNPGHWLGPAHRKCNRAEGARHRDLMKRARIVRRWSSRVW